MTVIYRQIILFSAVLQIHKAAIENLQRSFNLIQDTLSDLRLALNSEKSSFMFFSKARNVAFIKHHILSVDDSLTERVTDK